MRTMLMTIISMVPNTLHTAISAATDTAQCQSIIAAQGADQNVGSSHQLLLFGSRPSGWMPHTAVLSYLYIQ